MVGCGWMDEREESLGNGVPGVGGGGDIGEDECRRRKRGGVFFWWKFLIDALSHKAFNVVENRCDVGGGVWRKEKEVTAKIDCNFDL